MIDVESLVDEIFSTPGYRKKYLSRPLTSFLRYILHEKDFKDFEKTYPDAHGYDFVDRGLEFMDFSYSINELERERIPSEGRVVIVANHPIGSLDGLALIQLVRSVRPDVKIVANEILSKLKPLEPVMLPVDNMGGKTARQSVQIIRDHLEQDRALIIFPAGVVSRFGIKGLNDTRWRNGFLRFANATHSPILPIYVNGRNSTFFYVLSLVAFKISSTPGWCGNCSKHRHDKIDMRIGEIIPHASYDRLKLPRSDLVRLFRNHLYRFPKAKPGLFATQSGIAKPEDREALKAELNSAELLGTTSDGKIIYLYRYVQDSPVMNELGRVRELSFRSVGEGSGKRRDLDEYDTYYMHLILWDAEDEEIAGAYRLGNAAEIVGNLGTGGLYSSTIYSYQDAMTPYFQQGLELGRSFVQPRYWGRRSLDYLWYGIGALLRSNPQLSLSLWCG